MSYIEYPLSMAIHHAIIKETPGLGDEVTYDLDSSYTTNDVLKLLDIANSLSSRTCFLSFVGFKAACRVSFQVMPKDTNMFFCDLEPIIDIASQGFLVSKDDICEFVFHFSDSTNFSRKYIQAFLDGANADNFYVPDVPVLFLVDWVRRERKLIVRAERNIRPGD